MCPRCHKLIPQGLTYCEDCKPLAEAQAAEARERKAAARRKRYNQNYNNRRDPKYLQFYRSKDWRTLSRAYLQAAGYKCEAKLDNCQRLAVEVHHKQALRTDEGWSLRLDWSNLMAVCVSCHNQLDKRFGSRPEPGVIDLRKVTR